MASDKAKTARRGQPLRNEAGQAMGPKGRRTRQRLIEVTIQLLGEVGLRDLRVADIARTAQLSAGSFYLYFDDVTDVVLAALNDLSQSTPAVLGLVQEEWSRENGGRYAQALVESYLDYWAEHRTLFTVRNLAAEQGDARFRRLRELSILPVLHALRDKIAAAQATGAIDPALNAAATAGVLIAMIERLAAVSITAEAERPDYRGELVKSAAHVIALTLDCAPAR